MVKFDIVGLNDCPWYAKACKLADEISGINTMVEINREMLDKFHWTVRGKIKLLDTFPH
jgi:hypothetical protein